MKQKYMLALSGVIVIVAVLLVALIQVRSVRSDPQASTPTPTYGLDPNATIVLPIMPTAVRPKITDLAPDIPNEDKAAVVVQHADGSREMFLVAPDLVDPFISQLPKEDKLVQIISPGSIENAHP
jgi:hypothetical protein